MIRRLLAKPYAFCAAFRWSELECGCAFTVFGPRRMLTCKSHVHATEWIAGQLTGGRR